MSSVGGTSNDENQALPFETNKSRVLLKAKRHTPCRTSFSPEKSHDAHKLDTIQIKIDSKNIDLCEELKAIEEDTDISPVCKKAILQLLTDQNKMKEGLCVERKRNEQSINIISELKQKISELNDDIEASKQWQSAAYLQMQKMTEYNAELSKKFSELYNEVRSKTTSSSQTNNHHKSKSSSSTKSKHVTKAGTAVSYGDSIAAKKIHQRRRLKIVPSGKNEIVQNGNEQSLQNEGKNVTDKETLLREKSKFDENKESFLNEITENNEDKLLDEDKPLDEFIDTTKKDINEEDVNCTEPKPSQKLSGMSTESENEQVKTNSENDVADVETDISISLRQAAESVVSNSGFTYDKSTGMYYDWNSKMYYDTSSQLYYDHENGIYYYYDAERESYIFHSQIKVPAAGPDEGKSEAMENNRDEELSDGELRSDTSSEPDIVIDSCIRVTIVKSDTLTVGSLFIITCQGGTIGRDTNNQVCVPDEMVSRVHAQIIYDRDEQTFFLQDMQTQNGIFLNNERIADPKSSSDAIELTHRDYVTIGNTTMSFHVHLGNETCFDCEPGNIQAIIEKNKTIDSDVKVSMDLNKQRKQGNKSMMKKYGLAPGYLPKKLIESVPDRAGQRRREVGIEAYDNVNRPVEKASVHKEIPMENKGHKMLAKMGWKSGEGLGKSKQGIAQPVTVGAHGKNKGLGFGEANSIELDVKSTRKQEILSKTKERFQKL